MEEPTTRILALKNKFYNQYKQNKQEWVDRYEDNAEQAMVGAAFNRAKTTAMKEQKQRIKEMIKAALTRGPVEEINSVEFIQSRKPIEDKEKNPEDVVKMDVPLLLRMLEYAKEDAKTDMDLHFVTENLIKLSKNGRVLNMADYNSIVSSDEIEND